MPRKLDELDYQLIDRLMQLPMDEANRVMAQDPDPGLSGMHHLESAIEVAEYRAARRALVRVTDGR